MSPRLLVVNPNLTIDRTATIPALRPGEVLRTREVVVTPGGKGVNVVRTATRLGAPARLVAFLAGRIGDAAGEMLRDEGIDLEAVKVEGELRSTAVLTEDGGRVTVINEPGPTVTDGDWQAYEQLVADLVHEADVLVCSGSAPPGCPPDAFARLVGLARRSGVRSVVDANGDLLRAAVAAEPDAVTPNLAEAEGLDGGAAREDVDVDPASARARAVRAATDLVARGARAGVVTAGAAGAAMAWAGGGVWVPAPRVAVRNPIGAGDTFTAGLAVALAGGASLRDCLLAGVAAGAAGVEDRLAGGVDPARVDALRRTLHAERA